MRTQIAISTSCSATSTLRSPASTTWRSSSPLRRRSLYATYRKAMLPGALLRDRPALCCRAAAAAGHYIDLMTQNSPHQQVNPACASPATPGRSPSGTGDIGTHPRLLTARSWPRVAGSPWLVRQGWPQKVFLLLASPLFLLFRSDRIARLVHDCCLGGLWTQLLSRQSLQQPAAACPRSVGSRSRTINRSSSRHADPWSRRRRK